MGLDGWLEVGHVAAVAVWSAALLALAVGDARPRLVTAAAGVGAFAAVLTGVWLLHRHPRLLTMTPMHLKLAGLVALGLVDHLLVGGHRPAAFARRGVRVGALAAVAVALCVAAFVTPEAA